MTEYLTALKVGVCNTSTMRLLHQHEVALLVLYDRMMHIALAIKNFGKAFEPFFLWAKYHHLTICLRLMKPHCYLFIILTMVVLCFEKKYQQGYFQSCPKQIWDGTWAKGPWLQRLSRKLFEMEHCCRDGEWNNATDFHFLPCCSSFSFLSARKAALMGLNHWVPSRTNNFFDHLNHFHWLAAVQGILREICKAESQKAPV